MDDYLNVGGDEADQQPTDAVVVNPTASDDFAFMSEDNPYDGGAAVTTEDTQEQSGDMSKPKPMADDPFASMVDQPNEPADASMLLGGGDETSMDMKQDELSGDAAKETANDEPTFLSVWQEERKLELEKRRTTEREQQQQMLEEAQQKLEKFETDRAKRIENKKKENREKEKDLRDDLDAVFKHGTIWEQVGKMVNLNEKMSGLQKFDKDRFRDLLIHLRNAKQ